MHLRMHGLAHDRAHDHLSDLLAQRHAPHECFDLPLLTVTKIGDFAHGTLGDP